MTEQQDHDQPQDQEETDSHAPEDLESDADTKEPDPHDESYKRFFSNPVIVWDLLEGFVPGKWLKKLDKKTLEPVPGSFVSDISRQRHCDVVWRIQSKKKSEWVYIYLLIEFQSRPDRFMAVRLMTYVGLLLQALAKLPEYRRKETRLPAILPIVVYNGKARWTKPLCLSELLEPLPEGLRHLQPELCYLLLDEGRFDKAQLEAMRNLVAILFRLESSSGSGEVVAGLWELNRQIDLYRQQSAPGIEEAEQAYDIWLEQILGPRFPELNIGAIRGREGKTMLAQSLDEWIGNARQEGRLQAMQELVTRLLKRRFTPLPESVIREVHTIDSPARLSDMAEEILAAKSLEELGLG